jgi:hypothetical protein
MKIKKLEQLVRLKDSKIQTMSNKMAQHGIDWRIKNWDLKINVESKDLSIKQFYSQSVWSPRRSVAKNAKNLIHLEIDELQFLYFAFLCRIQYLAQSEKSSLCDAVWLRLTFDSVWFKINVKNNNSSRQSLISNGYI